MCKNILYKCIHVALYVPCNVFSSGLILFNCNSTASLCCLLTTRDLQIKLLDFIAISAPRVLVTISPPLSE